MDRTEVASGTEWEEHLQYARAVRVGDQIHVSGTTAIDEQGDPVAVGRPYDQAAHALGLVEDAIREAGGSPSDVVRTRLYVTDADQWPEIGRAHAEAFGAAKPASTLVEVERLVDRELLVEIEATAIVP